MRRKAAGLGILAALAAGVALSATPASAHSSLIGSTPQDGAVLGEAPDEVVLEFDEEVQPDFSQVAVLDAEENHYEDGDPVSAGPTVTQAVTDLPSGEYSISYRVGSADGHPVTGVITFTVDLPADAAAAGDEPATSKETADQPAGAETTGPAASEAASGDTEDEGGTSTESVVAAVAAVAVVGIVGVLLFRRRPNTTGGDSPPDGQ